MRALGDYFEEVEDEVHVRMEFGDAALKSTHLSLSEAADLDVVAIVTSPIVL